MHEFRKDIVLRQRMALQILNTTASSLAFSKEENHKYILQTHAPLPASRLGPEGDPPQRSDSLFPDAALNAPSGETVTFLVPSTL